MAMQHLCSAFSVGWSVGTTITTSSLCWDLNMHYHSCAQQRILKTTSLKSLHMDVTSLVSVVLVSAAAVTKGHKLGGLKQQEAIISCSGAWKPEIKVLAKDNVPMEVSGGGGRRGWGRAFLGCPASRGPRVFLFGSFLPVYACIFTCCLFPDSVCAQIFLL